MKEGSATILMGLPVTTEEFEARARDSEWDWGRQVGASPEAWQQAFDRQAEACAVAQEVLADARERGDEVVCCAKLEDLKCALARSPIVVLVAHWKGSAVAEADLLEGWAARVRELTAQPEHPLGELLRAAAVNGVDAGKVVVALDRAIERGELRRCLPAGLAERVNTSELIERTLARDLVDASFEGCLRQGNRLELFDGLHTLAALERAVPAGFAGVLDLSCCNSSVPATYLKLCLEPPIDAVHCDESLALPVQMRLVQWALRETHRLRGKHTYKEIRLECSRQVHDEYKRRKEKLS